MRPKHDNLVVYARGITPATSSANFHSDRICCGEIFIDVKTKQLDIKFSHGNDGTLIVTTECPCAGQLYCSDEKSRSDEISVLTEVLHILGQSL